LHLALEKCSGEIIKLLLSRVANVDAKGKDGGTYIHIAVEIGNLQIVKKLLLEYGGNVDA
jgi:ankyrin repeat protein